VAQVRDQCGSKDCQVTKPLIASEIQRRQKLTGHRALELLMTGRAKARGTPDHHLDCSVAVRSLAATRPAAST
ncbi:MAG: hypothetical protein ABJJ38_02750, partial [Roseibium sp.]|uniref:hypothetical protein n=1 Tax=Roseibium sp. TaxID=1936156 RepID=UPI003298E442